MIKKNSYKVKYATTKAHEDELIKEIAKLKEENKKLRIENESLWIENKSCKTMCDNLFKAGTLIAKEVVSLNKENLKLKIRLDVLSKRGVDKDAVQK